VTVVNQISTGVQDTVRAEIAAMEPMFVESAKRGVFSAIQQGGNAARVVGRRS